MKFKKAISLVATLSLAAVCAMSAFAASADVAALKAKVNSVEGVGATEKAAAVAFLTSYEAAGNADKLTPEIANAISGTIDSAKKDAKAGTLNAAAVTNYTQYAVDQLAKAGVTVSVADLTVSAAGISANVTASAPNVAAVTAAVSKNVKVDVSGGGVGTGTITPGAGAAAGTGSGVIKRTGSVSFVSTAVLAMALFMVLGTAAVVVSKKRVEA